MLVEALLISLLSASAALLTVYRVFTGSATSGGALPPKLTRGNPVREAVVFATFLGLVPAVVGFIVALPIVEKHDVAYVVFLVFAGLFVAAYAVRFSFYAAFKTGWDMTLIVPYCLIGVISALAVSQERGSSSVPVCLIYLSLYYFWTLDSGDDGYRSVR